MYTIPIIIIVISFSVIIAILVKHIKELANLSVESIPSVREAKFKEKIISNRLKRSLSHLLEQFTGLIIPFFTKGATFFKLIIHKVSESREKINSKKPKVVVNKDEQIEKLFDEADKLIKRGEFDESEKKLISIIEIDHKNIDAFATLGQVYFERKNYSEAKQTLEHVIRLEGASDEIFFDLALICKAMGNNALWFNYLKKAQKLNQNNPRYLDSLLDAAIVMKDKIVGLDVYKRLKSADSSNAKLEQFKKKISEL